MPSYMFLAAEQRQTSFLCPSSVWVDVFMPKLEVKTEEKTAVIMFHLV